MFMTRCQIQIITEIQSIYYTYIVYTTLFSSAIHVMLRFYVSTTVSDETSVLRFILMMKTGFLGALSTRTRYGSMGSSPNNSPVRNFATIGKTSSFGHLDLSIGDISMFEIYASITDSSLTRNGINFNTAMYCCNCKSKGISYIILLKGRFYRRVYISFLMQ